MHNAVDSFVFEIPFAVVVRYLFKVSGRGSTDIELRSSVVMGTKNCIVCGISGVRATLISWFFH